MMSSTRRILFGTEKKLGIVPYMAVGAYGGMMTGLLLSSGQMLHGGYPPINEYDCWDPANHFCLGLRSGYENGIRNNFGLFPMMGAVLGAGAGLYYGIHQQFFATPTTQPVAVPEDTLPSTQIKKR